MRAKLLSLGLVCIFVMVVMLTPTPVLADVCLVVYPDGATIYHYEAAEYYTVGPGNPLYDPLFDRGGEVLIDINTDEIALDVYEAPGLVGFVLDNENQGYFIAFPDYDLVVDGFSNTPTTYTNIILVFDTILPDGCVPVITVDGNPVLFDPGLGFYWPIGDLVVSTPTPTGGNFSDTVTHAISVSGCIGYRVYAFADDNFNLVRDGGECFTAFSHDLTVPAHDRTWGAVKSFFGE
ncbi:MAG: hypothetical protein O7D32_08760 [bacterium]|nr:hypothetical protein [bacterium]